MTRSGTVEAKLSHLDDLGLRLTDAGIDAAKLAADADPRVRNRARTKVLKQDLSPRDLTDAMRHPPPDRLYERARPWLSSSGRSFGMAGVRLEGFRSEPPRVGARSDL